jgi:PEP-CTERM motif
MKNQYLPIICAAGLALPLSSQAATVTWGSVSTIIDATTIVTTGATGIVGANFAHAPLPGALTANGVTFTPLGLNSSANIGGGITVATSSMNYTNNTGSISNVPAGNFGTIMDSHTGTFGGVGTITLSGLVDGTQYQIQFFASTNDTNALAAQTITGGAGTSGAFGNHAAGSGKTLLGTFTASGTTQVLTIQNGEVAANALTIGVIPEPSAALLGGLGMLGLLRRRRS